MQHTAEASRRCAVSDGLRHPTDRQGHDMPLRATVLTKTRVCHRQALYEHRTPRQRCWLQQVARLETDCLWIPATQGCQADPGNDEFMSKTITERIWCVPVQQTHTVHVVNLKRPTDSWWGARTSVPALSDACIRSPAPCGDTMQSGFARGALSALFVFDNQGNPIIYM